MLLVSDANVFIDLEAAGLVEQLFRLQHEIVVPDVLYEQELASRHAHLLQRGLRLEVLSGELIRVAYELQLKYREPSINDIFALVLARDLGCPLVTGDKRLRAAAEAEGLDLLGTLSLLEQMCELALVTVEELRAAYLRMRLAGRRLPWIEVAAQIERLGTKPSSLDA